MYIIAYIYIYTYSIVVYSSPTMSTHFLGRKFVARMAITKIENILMQWTILLTIQKRWMPADEGFIHLHGITIHKLVVCNPITLWWFLYVYRFMLMVDYYWILMDFEWIIYLLQQSNDQTTTSFIDHHPTLSQLSPILCEDQDSQKIVQQLHKPPSTYKNTQYPALNHIRI